MAQRAWFITGVNSGFGREMTEQLLQRGDRVAGTVRTLNSVRDLTEKYGDRFWTAHLDVTDTAEVRTVVDAAFSAFGAIDVVVNNAGYGLFGAAEEFTDEQVVHEIATNLLGSIQVVRSALPHLRAQQQARIIQISTFGGQAALPGGSMYHASSGASKVSVRHSRPSWPPSTSASPSSSRAARAPASGTPAPGSPRRWTPTPARRPRSSAACSPM
jgi:NAD(P)-dependent dehydrogenase (short-subunit alcohol dehydrogenase family)